jgi:hypothetical protein
MPHNYCLNTLNPLKNKESVFGLSVVVCSYTLIRVDRPHHPPGEAGLGV